MEFWSETATQASWEALQKISKEFSFTLIGGWAVYLWTRQHKSKGIDVIVDFKTLDYLKRNYALEKNDRLHKYEIKSDLFDIDVYVPHYSKLTLPLEEVVETAQNVQGVKAASPEALLVLKQGACMARKESVKGRKDAIDILTLLMHAPINFGTYDALLDEHGLPGYKKQLVETVKDFDAGDLKFLDSNVHDFKKWKTAFFEEFKKT